MISKIFNVYKKLNQILTAKQKILAIIVLVASLISAIFETLGVSVIIPLVNALIQPHVLWDNEIICKVAFYFRIKTDDDLIKCIIVATIVLYASKNLFFIFNTWLKNKYSFKVQRETSVAMMTSYMKRGYVFFLNHNFNELRQGVEADVQSLYYVVTNTMQLIAQLMIIALIGIFMCVVDWGLFLSVSVSASICLIIIVGMFRQRMLLAGQKVRKYSIRSSKVLMEAFHGVKEVFVMRKQNYYLSRYNNEVTNKNRASVTQTIGSEIPAYIIEMICIIGIMIILLFRSSNMENAEGFVAVLASFAVGAFRMLPALGKISTSVNAINSCLPGFGAVYENMIDARKDNLSFFDNQIIDDERYKNLDFKNRIQIENVSFKYDDSRMILMNLNMVIPRGRSVAFVGESGAGKSTLADIILGVLKPSDGRIMLDDVDINLIPNRWSQLIGFVPQTIYLTDSSIRENVAFGVDEAEIEDRLVEEALRKAEILDFINTLPQNIYTEVGDRGVRLSGGQRQRIGIARALYHNPQILVLDEATSALDNETEKAVMDSIDMLHGTITLIVIAHRLTTVKNCDVIYEITGGKSYERRYDEIIQR